jgi:hypothetical protein
LILVFTEGTILVHASGTGIPREDVVKQVEAGRDPSLRDFAHYVAIGRAAAKLWNWRRAGARVAYLTSRRIPEEVRSIRMVLRASHCPSGRLLFRREGETYAHVAERIVPDVIVEDDCESIGGEREMTYPHIRIDLRRQIRSIVVPEFAGIDHLPDDPVHLTQ